MPRRRDETILLLSIHAKDARAKRRLFVGAQAVARSVPTMGESIGLLKHG